MVGSKSLLPHRVTVTVRFSTRNYTSGCVLLQSSIQCSLCSPFYLSDALWVLILTKTGDVVIAPSYALASETVASLLIAANQKLQHPKRIV